MELWHKFLIGIGTVLGAALLAAFSILALNCYFDYTYRQICNLSKEEKANLEFNQRQATACYKKAKSREQFEKSRSIV